MQKNKKIFVALVFLLLSFELANATTIFARQYNTNCNTCHIGVPPTLNSTGEDFLRNGMRFSQNDKTTLQRFLSDEDKVLPIGFFLGVVNKNATVTAQTPKGKMTQENEATNPTLTLISAGSINENFSAFVGARFAYAQPNPNIEQKELRRLREKVYIQYNQGPTHVTRAGILLPYPDASENSGLSDNPDLYISPVDRANLKPLYGAEYSYMTKNGFTLLVAAGVQGRANNERSVMGEINYDNDALNGSIIINNFTATKSESQMQNYTQSDIILGERLNIMTPLEVNLKYFYLNLTGVYEKNDKVLDGDYYGFESTLTVPIFETANIRFIYTDDNKDEQGYALKYSHIFYENFFFNANYVKIQTQTKEFDSLAFGLSLVY